MGFSDQWVPTRDPTAGRNGRRVARIPPLRLAKDASLRSEWQPWGNRVSRLPHYVWDDGQRQIV
jgi:hypothetical protein